MVSAHRFASHPAAARLAVLLPLLCGGLAAPVAPALAQVVAPDGLAVSGITVDVTAADANAARDRAIAQAQRKAWDELFKKLLPPGNKAPTISDVELSRAVQNFSVDDERLSPGRYAATMTVRFAAGPVRDAVAASGAAAVVEPASQPLVLLPLTIQPDGSAVLWEDRTAWRAAWEAREAKAGALVPLTVPDGELSDIAAAGAPEALAGDARAFAKIAGLYKAGGVAVVKTTLGANGPDVTQGMRVDISLTTLDGASAAKTLTIRGDAADRPEDLLSRAVVSAAAAIDELWRKEHTVSTAPQETITAAVQIANLNDWIAARQKLGQIGGGARVDMLSLSRTAALVSIAHRGPVAELQDRLSRQGITLSQGPAGWVITLPPVGASAPAPTPTTIPAVEGAAPPAGRL